MEKIPKDEIDKRVSNFQIRLLEKEIAGALVTRPISIYYFSGTAKASILFIPREGNPILLSDEDSNRVESGSLLMENIATKIKEEIPFAIGDNGRSNSTSLGLEMDTLPVNEYLWLKKAFPRCTWTNISNVLFDLRAVKSPYEILQMKSAAAVLDKGFKEITEIIREDMTEFDLERYLVRAPRQDRNVGIGKRICDGELESDIPLDVGRRIRSRRIKRNEPIAIEYCVSTNGYIAVQLRTFVIGALAPMLRNAHDSPRQIHHVLSKEGKAGVSCNYLYELANKKAEEDGYAHFFMGYKNEKVMFVGHGIGLEISEFPLIASGVLSQLKAGMIIALEPRFVFPDIGMVGLEDMYLVTSAGLERLTITRQAVIGIS
jgi:Xaa-Pro aminopeptidase